MKGKPYLCVQVHCSSNSFSSSFDQVYYTKLDQKQTYKLLKERIGDYPSHLLSWFRTETIDRNLWWIDLEQPINVSSSSLHPLGS